MDTSVDIRCFSIDTDSKYDIFNDTPRKYDIPIAVDAKYNIQIVV